MYRSLALLVLAALTSGCFAVAAALIPSPGASPAAAATPVINYPATIVGLWQATGSPTWAKLLFKADGTVSLSDLTQSAAGTFNGTYKIKDQILTITVPGAPQPNISDAIVISPDLQELHLGAAIYRRLT